MLVPVYDIINCGPRHRFAANGKLVHNSQGINLQNLTRVDPSDPTSGRLRHSIQAPPGYRIVVCDLSAIEARVNAWLAGQEDAVNVFANNGDIYCVMAESLYGRRVTKADKQERRLGKTVVLGCIAEGERVLTDHGLIEIQNITIDMRVWDGVEFVAHTGVIYQGDKEVMTYGGLTATPDHIVFLRNGRTCELSEAAEKNYPLARTGYAQYPLRYVADHQLGIETEGEAVVYHVPMSMRARAVGGQVESPAREIKGVSGLYGRCEPHIPELGDAGEEVRSDSTQMSEPAEPALPGLWGAWHRMSFSLSGRVHSVGRKVSTALRLQRGRARSSGQQRALRARELEACDKGRADGEPTQHGLDNVSGAAGATSPRVPRHKDCSAERNVLTPHGRQSDTEARTYDRAGNRQVLYAGIKQTKRTYDITNAGPRHRFTVSGVLVHNCGYGMSWKRFYDYAINVPGGAIIFGDEEVAQFGLSPRVFMADAKNAMFVKVNRPRHWAEESFAAHCCVCDYIIKVYRTTNYAIKAQWDDCRRALHDMYNGNERQVGRVPGVVWTAKDSLITPNNRLIYPGLATKDGREFTRQTRDGLGFLNGSLLTENIVQHLSRQIMAEQTLEARRCGLNVVFTCHDEIVTLERESEAEEAYKVLERIMSTPPAWAPGLPLACEGGTARTYGEAK